MRYFLLLLVFFGVSSCDSNRVFEDFKEMNNEWPLEKPVVFEFESDSTNNPYKMEIHIKNDMNYQFYNLYYKVRIMDPDGKVLADELKEIILFDPKTGEPFGSGLGNSFDNTAVIFDEFNFPRSQTYNISLRQYMRTDTLPNIERVGLKISLTE